MTVTDVCPSPDTYRRTKVKLWYTFVIQYVHNLSTNNTQCWWTSYGIIWKSLRWKGLR